MRVLFLIPLLALLFVSGCSRLTQSAESTPPDYMEVIGIGQAQGEGSGPASWAQTLGEAIAATAQVDLNTTSTTPEKLMAARAASRRGALRNLSSKLEDAPLDPRMKVRDWLSGAPAEDRLAFENLIEQQAVVAWNEQNGRDIAVASIPTSVVSTWIMEHARPAGDATASDPSAALNVSAFNAAEQDARKKLRQELLALDVGNGKTLAKAIEENPSIGTRLDGILHVVPIDEVKYPSVGNCQVKIFFDRNVARGLATRRSFRLFNRS